MRAIVLVIREGEEEYGISGEAWSEEDQRRETDEEAEDEHEDE